MHLLILACNHQLTSNLSTFDHHSKTNPTKDRTMKKVNQTTKATQPVEFSKEGKDANQPPQPECQQHANHFAQLHSNPSQTFKLHCDRVCLHQLLEFMYHPNGNLQLHVRHRQCKATDPNSKAQRNNITQKRDTEHNDYLI